MASSPAGNRVGAVIFTFTLLSGITVFFRLFTRVAVIRNAGLEDVLIALAMGFSIGLTATIGAQIQNGMGKHIFELLADEMIDSQKAFWASIWIYYLALAFTKLSILVQYLRIFPTRRFRIVCSVVIGLVALYGVWGLFGSIFLCVPVHSFWDKSVGGKCMDQFAVWFSNAAMNIAQDFVILLLPMPVLRRLSIPTRQKKALMIVFALGGIVCIVSVVRLHSLFSISNSRDPTFDNPPAATLSSVETNIGIITACLPSMRPLLSAMMPNYFPRSTPSYYANGRSEVDEEQPKRQHHPHTRNLSAASTLRPATGTTLRPTTASTGKAWQKGHSRSTSDTTHYTSTTELSSLSSSTKPSSYRPTLPPNHHEKAAVFGTGPLIHGPARQVHIRSASRTPSIQLAGGAPRLPRLPENVAVIGDLSFYPAPLFSGGSGSGHRRSASSPLASSVYSNSRPRMGSRTRPTTPLVGVVQKPLPITPFPVATDAT
ncbi:uncharacterized protein EI97DRAFT_301179 [Westerdykella ornata]|uniref:Rhodopsin domain-containing protein n=1 Tax=Westerdykella ornata TaxID=318751 RepID=A0A6A6JN68_WESOR|nr:uncharacterized protein EI97DRAFT_301179 [Westerdykella ornata]KAF2277675.1 hypothetical protein EI97DRAFT_301179 [Westerdykella ornata]